MFSVCMRYARDRGEAEDLLQEGFMTVFTKIGSFNALGSLEGWMRKVFVTTALMKLRKGDVLKDAASASIYGVRGANGVILVTTRKR